MPASLKFSDLNINAPLSNALESMGLSHPTIIQQRAFPVVMSGKNVVGLAQTGTGKTIAYLLPMLRMLDYSNKYDPRILILVPTRELVIQVVEEVEKLTSFMTVRVAGVYGGANINTQKETVAAGLDILVATPGRLMDLALGGFLRLKAVQRLVIDEVDEMMDLGFSSQLNTILDILPQRRQNLLFSATMIPQVEALIEENFPDVVKIEAAPNGTPLESIEQRLYRVPNFNSKTNLLTQLLCDDGTMSKVLVFADSKRQADLLYEVMASRFGNEVGIIHSGRSQPQRFAALRSFSAGELRVLIATDLVARGLDIVDVTHVVSFDVPEDAPNFIHRIGRTGRADRTGVALAFATEKEEGALRKVEALMKRAIPVCELPEGTTLSEVLIEDEKPYVPGITYTQSDVLKSSGGAFHEKSAKNSKVNLGGPHKRSTKNKNRAPKTRGQKRK
jgi:ATP-dependent RNA helicase RhlE